MHEKFTKLGYSLPLEIHQIDHQIMDAPDVQKLTTYHVKPLDWMKYWMKEAPELLGGAGNVFLNFKAFWEAYRVSNPEHMVFSQHGHRLDRVIPLLLHGDEGRAVKRSNFLVLSVESPLGGVEDPTIMCDCHEKLAGRAEIDDYGEDFEALSGEVLQLARKQFTNFKGHTFLSRWILFGAGGWLYKRHPHIVDEILQVITGNLKTLFDEGFDLDGAPMFGAVLAIKGDMDFHKKTMSLSRSYANLGDRNDISMCHSCMAGSPGCRFEDFSEAPEWEATMHLERPWPQDNPPVLAQLPYNELCPEELLQWDMFHVFRLGVGRDLVGGILIILLRLGFMDYAGSTTNIVDRLTRAHSCFALWCHANSLSPGLRSFTKAYFNLKSLMSAPWASSKGSDTVLLLRWLKHTLSINIINPVVPGHERLLKEMHQVCDSALDLGMIHKHKLWMERRCTLRLYISLMTVLRGYQRLAERAISLKIRAFILKAKHHALHHIAVKLRNELRKGATLVPNPAMYSCDLNEDFLGRVSRLSRRVGFKLVHLRVLHRMFFKTTVLIRRRRRLKGRPPRKHVLQALKRTKHKAS